MMDFGIANVAGINLIRMFRGVSLKLSLAIAVHVETLQKRESKNVTWKLYFHVGSKTNSQSYLVYFIACYVTHLLPKNSLFSENI